MSEEPRELELPPAAGPPDAGRLFEGLAGELEEGRGDPEALFAAHSDLATELRELYRGWLAADALLRAARVARIRPGPSPA